MFYTQLYLTVAVAKLEFKRNYTNRLITDLTEKHKKHYKQSKPYHMMSR